MASDRPVFSAESIETDDESYRPLSLMAIATLVMGFFSSFSLLYIGTVVLAVLTLIVGIFALRSLKRDDRTVGVLPTVV